MYFAYIDESGVGTDGLQHYFVLSAIIVKTDRCLRIQEGLNRLKAEFHFIDVEIKGRDIEQSKNLFQHISLSTKREFVKRLIQLLFENELYLLTVVFAKEEEGVKRLNLSDEAIYHLSYKEILRSHLKTKNNNDILLLWK